MSLNTRKTAQIRPHPRVRAHAALTLQKSRSLWLKCAAFASGGEVSVLEENRRWPPPLAPPADELLPVLSGVIYLFIQSVSGLWFQQAQRARLYGDALSNHTDLCKRENKEEIYVYKYI